MHEAHDAYLCIGEKTYVNVKERRKYSNQHYLKNSEEMHKLFKDLPDALKNNENFHLRISYRPKNSSPILPNIQETDSKNVDDILKTSSKVLKDYSYSYKEKYRENTDILLKVFWRESVKKIGDYINEK